MRIARVAFGVSLILGLTSSARAGVMPFIPDFCLNALVGCYISTSTPDTPGGAQTTATAQDTFGGVSRQLDYIAGVLSDPSSADLFLIYIADSSSFSAFLTTDNGDGSFTPQLFLFNSAGAAIAGEGSSFSLGTTDNIVGVPGAGFYYLGVSDTNFYPVSATGHPLFCPFFGVLSTQGCQLMIDPTDPFASLLIPVPDPSDPTGATPLFFPDNPPLGGWVGQGTTVDPAGSQYHIEFLGGAVNTTPEPASILLTAGGLALAAALARRRRSRALPPSA